MEKKVDQTGDKQEFKKTFFTHFEQLKETNFLCDQWNLSETR